MIGDRSLDFLTRNSITTTPEVLLQGFFCSFHRLEPLMTRSILIYDTTLRDGTQGEGVSLSLQDKLHIAERLRRLESSGSKVGIRYPMKRM